LVNRGRLEVGGEEANRQIALAMPAHAVEAVKQLLRIVSSARADAHLGRAYCRTSQPTTQRLLLKASDEWSGRILKLRFCVARAAGISLQPVGFWPDRKGEKAVLQAVEG